MGSHLVRTARGAGYMPKLPHSTHGLHPLRSVCANLPLCVRRFVNSNGVSGAGRSAATALASIADAISRAEPGDLILLLPGEYTGPSNTNIVAPAHVTIASLAGPAVTTIDCTGSTQPCRFVEFTDMSQGAVVAGLTVSGGSALDGSGVDSGGCLLVSGGEGSRVENMVFTNCTASRGGAVAVLGGASTQLVNLTATECTADIGGAVFLELPLVAAPPPARPIVDALVLERCNATVAGGGLAVVALHAGTNAYPDVAAAMWLRGVSVLACMSRTGGGIWFGPASVTAEVDCPTCFAKATAELRVEASTVGSCVAVEGAGIASMSSTSTGTTSVSSALTTFNMLCTGSTVRNNTAELGGGVLVEGTTVTVTNSNVRGNAAASVLHLLPDAVVNGAFGTPGAATNRAVPRHLVRYGGGIAVRDFASLLVNDGSQITENTAVQGAGVYAVDSHINVIESLVSANVATMNGGGLLTTYTWTPPDAGAIMADSIVRGNTAAYGGGLWTDVPLFMSTNSTFVQNRALEVGGHM